MYYFNVIKLWNTISCIPINYFNVRCIKYQSYKTYLHQIKCMKIVKNKCMQTQLFNTQSQIISRNKIYYYSQSNIQCYKTQDSMYQSIYLS